MLLVASFNYTSYNWDKTSLKKTTKWMMLLSRLFVYCLQSIWNTNRPIVSRTICVPYKYCATIYAVCKTQRIYDFLGQIKSLVHVGDYHGLVWGYVSLGWFKRNNMIMGTKGHHVHCDTVAYWCVFNWFWITRELCGTEEEYWALTTKKILISGFIVGFVVNRKNIQYCNSIKLWLI